jgi:hypothetical protein
MVFVLNNNELNDLDGACIIKMCTYYLLPTTSSLSIQFCDVSHCSHCYFIVGPVSTFQRILAFYISDSIYFILQLIISPLLFSQFPFNLLHHFILCTICENCES